MRSSLAAVAATVAFATAPPAGAEAPHLLWVPMCGSHDLAAIPLPRRQQDRPQGCHAACAAVPDRKRRG